MPISYTSTRAKTPDNAGFDEILLAGLAPDGGLFMPRHWPQVSEETLAGFASQNYAASAAHILSLFAPDENGLADMCAKAYQGFDHAAITPLRQIGAGLWLLELFHGPSLSFKDVAMQALAQMMETSLARKNRRATILAATSGDTGAAAVEAFKNKSAIDVFVLYPHGRISELQRRQMTTSSDPHIHAIAVNGDFDACQSVVKQVFADAAFRQNARLTGVNSINWARLAAQIVYYFTAAAALAHYRRGLVFCVPTGNFGNVFAGFAAQQMGAPIAKLLIATNANDTLARIWQTGEYRPGKTIATCAPAMDIQTPSNFERLVFEACERDGEHCASLFLSLAQSGAVQIPSAALDFIRRHFSVQSASEEKIAARIAKVHQETGVLLDPHTAAAVPDEPLSAAPHIVLATAHPAKFPAAYAHTMPPALAHLANASETLHSLPADPQAVKDFIKNKARVFGSEQ